MKIPKSFESENELSAVLFQIIEQNLNSLPPDFNEALSKAIREKQCIKKVLYDAGAMGDWDLDNNVLKNSWTIETVKKVYNYLNREKSRNPEINHSIFDCILNSLTNRPMNEIKELSKTSVSSRYSKVMGEGECNFVSLSDFVKLRSIQEQIKFDSNEAMKGWARDCFDYLLQKIKMWDCNSLWPERLNGMINTNIIKTQTNSRRPLFDRGPMVNTATQIKEKIPVSKLDFLTCKQLISNLLIQFVIN